MDETLTRVSALLEVGRAHMAAERARVEVIVAAAARLRAALRTKFWELGRKLIVLRDAKAHAALGMSRIDDVFAERVGVPKATAWKLLTIAERLPREAAQSLGQERAYALVALARAMPGSPDPAALWTADAPIHGKRLSELSVRELQRASVAARAPVSPRAAARRRQAAEHELVAAIEARFAALGLPRPVLSVDGGEITARWSRRVARRLRGA